MFSLTIKLDPKFEAILLRLLDAIEGKQTAELQARINELTHNLNTSSDALESAIQQQGEK